MNNENIKKSNIEIIDDMINRLENKRNDLHAQYEAIINKDFSNIHIRWLELEQESNNKKALEKSDDITYISGKLAL